MKSILSILKADRICARADKDHDKFATLTLVIGEYDVAKALKKNLTRDENDVVIDVIRAYVTKVNASIEEFKKLVMDGALTDTDGSGLYATETSTSDVEIVPSDVEENLIREDFSHVMWFNK